MRSVSGKVEIGVVFTRSTQSSEISLIYQVKMLSSGGAGLFRACKLLRTFWLAANAGVSVWG